MAVQQNIKRRIYQSPGVVANITRRNRTPSEYDQPRFGRKGSAPGRSEYRPQKLPLGGPGAQSPSAPTTSGVTQRAGPSGFARQQPLGQAVSGPSRFTDPAGAISAGMRPTAHPDPGAAISAGMGTDRPDPSSFKLGLPSVRPDPATAISTAMGRAPAPRAGVHRGGEGATTRAGHMRDQGFLPFGQTMYDQARAVPGASATTPGTFYGVDQPMGVGPFEVATPGTVFSRPPPIDFGNLGLEVANAQNLAKQIEMQQSEAGRSFGVPLSPGEDDPGTYEKIFYSNQGDVNLDDPEADREAAEPSPEERAKSEGRIRLQSEMNRRAQGEDDDLSGDAHDAFAERLEGIDELVEKGFTTYQEALWLLRNGMYIDRTGQVRRTSGINIEDDEVIMNLEPGEKGRTVSHEDLAEELGIEALTPKQQSEVYDPEYGYTELGQQAPGDAASETATGEYGYPEGSWEDEMYRAMFENPMPQHSDEEIESNKQSIQEANRGAYMDAMRAAAYQNQMMGGSSESLMGVQADMMRRVGQQNAQQQLAREFQLTDENYRGMIIDAQKKHDVLMQIAFAHQGEELSGVAWARAKRMAEIQLRMRKDYAAWADENLGPSGWETAAQFLGMAGGAALGSFAGGAGTAVGAAAGKALFS